MNYWVVGASFDRTEHSKESKLNIQFQDLLFSIEMKKKHVLK